jgi:hypothetical protein
VVQGPLVALPVLLLLMGSLLPQLLLITGRLTLRPPDPDGVESRLEW